MANKHLKLESQAVTRTVRLAKEDCWFYEEPFGLTIVVNEESKGGKSHHIIISWAKIKSALKRKDRS